MGEVAKESENAVPNGGSEERVQGEWKKLHLGKARRYGNQLADNCNQAPNESGNGSVFAKVVFGLLHFAHIKQQKVAKTAVSEFVYNRSTEELCQVVVDECSDKSTNAT